MSLELAECPHTEEVIIMNHPRLGMELATCKVCRQSQQYPDGRRIDAVITRIGRIGQAVVLPTPGTPLSITPEETRLVRQGYDIVHKERGNIRLSSYFGVTVVHDPLALETDRNKPENWDDMDRKAKALWFDSRRKDIIADIPFMTGTEISRRWSMSSGTLHGLRQRWRNAGFDVPDSPDGRLSSRCVPGVRTHATKLGVFED